MCWGTSILTPRLVQRDQESEKDSAKESKDHKDNKDKEHKDSNRDPDSLTPAINSVPATSLNTSTNSLKVMEKGNMISVNNGTSTKDGEHKTPRYMMVSSAPLDEKEEKRKTTDSPKINRRDRSLSSKLDKDRRDSHDRHDKEKHDKDKHDKKHHRDSDSESSEGKKEKKKHHHRAESAKSSLRNSKSVKEELEKHDEPVTSPILVQQVNLSTTTPTSIHSPRDHHKHKHRSSDRPHHNHHHEHDAVFLAATTDLDTRHRKKSSGSDSSEEPRSPERKHKHHHSKDKKDNKDKKDRKELENNNKEHGDVVITVVAPKDELSASEKRRKDNKDSGGHSTSKGSHNSDDEDHESKHESKSERDKKRAKDNKHDDEKDKHHRDKSKRHTMTASLDVKKEDDKKDKHRSLHESEFSHEDSHKEKDKHHKDKNNKDKSDEKLLASNINNNSNKSS